MGGGGPPLKTDPLHTDPLQSYDRQGLSIHGVVANRAQLYPS